MPQDDYEYILYVDEAGDDGLRKVRPIDPDGGSEWLCVGAVLIRAVREPHVVDWVKRIRADIRSKQGPALHFNKLSLERRVRACQMLGDLPCRLFVVCSNKKNMRGYTNPRAAKQGGKQWFYNFCVRFLMERATAYCFERSLRELGRPGILKVTFSQRGGHSYGQTMAYWEKLKRQSIGGSTHLP